MNSGLWLLFLVFVGTIGFPPIVAVAFGTDMTSLWAMQGLFLIAILVVCGASYPIERFYTVNLTVLVIGIALVTVTIAAPMHAFYRNACGYEERRNFYRPAALELTRRWNQVTRFPQSVEIIRWLLRQDSTVQIIRATGGHLLCNTNGRSHHSTPSKTDGLRCALAMTRYAVSGSGMYAQPHRMPSVLTST